ncbi:MAG: IS3 family transposase [Spirochaetales bacterium]|nr:IS3 family transposase [Spirochaetales bacterium]
MLNLFSKGLDFLDDYDYETLDEKGTITNNIKYPNFKTYKTIDEARSSFFDYIEFFYNPKRRHDYLGGISSNEFEKKLNVS